MELFKNIEAMLMLSFVALCTTAWLSRPVPPVASDNAARAPAPAAIVIVTAKRLSEAEKRGS